MGLLELVLLLTLGPIGFLASIGAIGWFATVRHRLEHEREMFRLREWAKANAIDVQERQLAVLERAKDVPGDMFPWGGERGF